MAGLVYYSILIPNHINHSSNYLGTSLKNSIFMNYTIIQLSHNHFPEITDN